MPNEQDVFTLTVLEDGTAKIETSGISPAFHAEAEDMLRAFDRDLGGDSTIKQKPKQHHQREHSRAKLRH